jgi:hypothetical protein
MTTPTPAIPSAPRTALLGASAAVAAALLAHGIGWTAGSLMVAALEDEVIGANIGAGMVAVLLPFLLGPLLAWPLLRLFRVARPGPAVLVSLPLYLVWAGVLLWGGPLAVDPVREWAYALADAAGLAAAVVAGALLIRPRRKG